MREGETVEALAENERPAAADGAANLKPALLRLSTMISQRFSLLDCLLVIHDGMRFRLGHLHFVANLLNEYSSAHGLRVTFTIGSKRGALACAVSRDATRSSDEFLMNSLNRLSYGAAPA